MAAVILFAYTKDEYRVKTTCDITFNNGSYIAIEKYIDKREYNTTIEFAWYRNATDITCYYTKSDPSTISIYPPKSLYNDKYEPIIYLCIILFGFGTIVEYLLLTVFAYIICLRYN